jgi:ZIP family zinc transporter
MVLDRLALMHMHGHSYDHDEECDNYVHAHARGLLGATSLSFHSLLDGIAIGLAFHVSIAIGAVVAIAVLVHDFSDGINTVNVISKNGGEKKLAFRWLSIDAIAPLVGVMLTFFFTVPEKYLGLILSLFAGFFLYIGASDLLPESHHGHPKFVTIITTLLGAGVLYLAILFTL